MSADILGAAAAATPNFLLQEATSSSSKQQQFCDFSVYVVTYNVGSRFPEHLSLRKLLNLTSNDQKLPDVYAIGLQEINLQPQQQVLGLFKEDQWTRKVKKHLRAHDYVLVKTEQMQGLLISMFVLREHVLHLRDVEAEFTRTGFGGIWGNKGAVSIRFTLYGSGIAFVCAHLAAHDHHLDERIEDYKQILEHHHYHVPRYREIFDHEYIFWFGDLNFRLHGDDSPEEVRELVKVGFYAELLQRDQLLTTRTKTQDAFHLLNEQLPDFAPTFKFHEGTSQYDMKRRPAWTDRILYAVQPLNKQPNLPLTIELQSYKALFEYNISDHKPVTALFNIKLNTSFRDVCVHFTDLALWQVGEENTVEYTKPLDFEERDHDWIGIFQTDFDSLADYVAYEYVNQAETPPTPDTIEDPFIGPSTHQRHHHRNRQRLRRQQTVNAEAVRIDFSDDIELKHGETYVLIYFQNTGLRGVTSVSGISNTFRAENRQHSPRRHSHSPRPRSRSPRPH